MMFLYSLKLYASNWGKTLKLFLYYIVVGGLCFALLVPVFSEFRDIIVSAINNSQLYNSLSGVFQTSLGDGIHVLINTCYDVLVSIFETNLGLAVYGLIVTSFILPFLINVGKYTFCEMLYSYMTSKNKTGFFSAMMRGLKKSLVFAFFKTLCNIVFFVFTMAVLIGIGSITNEFFVTYLLPIVIFFVLVLLFTLYQMFILGWMPALIVFNCNIFSAHHKGMKAVTRHFWPTFATTMLYFFIFWLLVTIFGIYTMVVLVPLITILLCVYNMVMFFFSQGMRFYYNNENILTPRKLEEVDNINKTLFIL